MAHALGEVAPKAGPMLHLGMRHSREAAVRVKEKGLPNDLLDRLRGEPLMAGVDLTRVLDPSACRTRECPRCPPVPCPLADRSSNAPRLDNRGRRRRRRVGAHARAHRRAADYHE